jgi:hypothetical protein
MLVGRTIRRGIIAGLGGAAAWPVGAGAQQPRMRVIGLLSGTQAEDRLLGALREAPSAINSQKFLKNLACLLHR